MVFCASRHVLVHRRMSEIRIHNFVLFILVTCRSGMPVRQESQLGTCYSHVHFVVLKTGAKACCGCGVRCACALLQARACLLRDVRAAGHGRAVGDRCRWLADLPFRSSDSAAGARWRLARPVAAVLAGIGLALPLKRIDISVLPIDLPKAGSHYELPVTLALLGALGATDTEQLLDFVVLGRVAPSGRVVATPGVILAALHASREGKVLICPSRQSADARLAGSVSVLGAPDLISLLNHLKGTQVLPMPLSREATLQASRTDMEALASEIAASSEHDRLPPYGHDVYEGVRELEAEIVAACKARHCNSSHAQGF